MRALSALLAIGSLAVASAFAPAAFAESVGASGSTANGTGNATATTTVTVTITALRPYRTWQDLHIYPPAVEGFPKPSLPDLKDKKGTVEVKDASGATVATWSVTQDSSGIHVLAPSSPGLPDGTYTFTLTWKDKKFGASQTTQDVRYVVTGNGGLAYCELDVLGDKAHQPHGPGFPVALMQFRGPDPEEGPVVCSRGVWTPFTGRLAQPCDSVVTYGVVMSLSPDACYSHWDSHDQECLIEPVPQAWGLGTMAFQGGFDEKGRPVQAPQLFVPQDPALVGNVFYVALLGLAADGSVVVVGGPLQVVIQ